MIRTKRLTEEVYVADEPIVNLGQSDIDFLKGHVHQTQRKRVRLCAHKDAQDKLHEMFVCYVKETYVHPNKHIKKDESLHIIQGAADFIFFDEHGTVTDVVPLGDYASGRQFYCRIPESIYHTFIIKSDIIILHESTPGPFRREDTVFAPWAPEEQNTQAIAKFMAGLAKTTSNAAVSSR